IEKQQVIARRHGRAVIPRPGSSSIRWQTCKLDAVAVLSEYLARSVAGSIVHHDNFGVLITLKQSGVHRLADKFALVVAGKDNAVPNGLRGGFSYARTDHSSPQFIGPSWIETEGFNV